MTVQHASHTRVQIHPFSSAKKRMSTIVRLNGGYRMFVKGASEILLPLCARQVKGTSTEALSAADIVWCCRCAGLQLMWSQASIHETIIDGYAKDALRVLLLAYRDFDSEQDWEDEDALAQHMTLLAIVGIQVCGLSLPMDGLLICQDPVRDEVPEAVATCRRAGVTVRMVTGDNLTTARAIALNCGIITAETTGDYAVIEGVCVVLMLCCD